MGGTIDWAVDLAKYQGPPSYDVEGIDLNLSWLQVKANTNSRGTATCDETSRTGDWINKSCREDEVVDFDEFTPKDRWKALECQAAWDDVIQYWYTCARTGSSLDFPQVVAKFLRLQPNTTLNNYYASVKEAGTEVERSKETFIGTFAPKADDDGKVLTLLLSILQIPISIAGAWFFARTFFEMPVFAKNLDGNEKDALEDSVMGLIGVGFNVVKEALKSAADNREEIAFEDIYESIVGKWQDQVDKFPYKIFDGSTESINALTAMFKDGKMITGLNDGNPDDDSNDGHTDNWNRGMSPERAFYASAIPAAWTANNQAPVIADFGQTCEIDARGHFPTKPENYNKGWRCTNGHSYILATA
ncbi:Chitinase [Colletotrichum higginsianum IMI 349063]|uniref:Chitinase n=1 Tax=Colletotrichum higginsianum (strain IMI 349063) TaxID=759273 RepID=A0A1B7XQC2_COLHI|nr:Chitinase [Colletotrichum higginsianum IMI 349063]OBR01962.1 Chitinase [Colletotrichum higginsianum IMI 349063]